MMTKVLIAIFILLASLNVPADSGVSLAHVQAHTAEFEYYRLDKNGELERAGTWTDSVEFDGTSVIRTVKRKPTDAPVDLVRTIIADRHTLQPARLNQRFGPGLVGVYYSEFKDRQFTQLLLSDTKNEIRQMSTPFQEDLVENNLQGFLVAALPFSERESIQVEGYSNGQKPARSMLTFSVEGQETVETMGEEFLAWKVTEQNSNWTYWVREEMPYLVKVMHPAPGGTTLVSYVTGYRAN